MKMGPLNVAARATRAGLGFVGRMALLAVLTAGTAWAAPLVEEVSRLPGYPAFSLGSGSNANLSGGQFVVANDGYHGLELWFTDGTQAGTRMVKDLNPGTGHSLPRSFVVLNDKLYFIAEVHSDRQLWVSDGTEAGTYPVINLYSSNDSVQELVVFNGALYFHAIGDGGTGIYTSDGTAAGTSLVVEVSYAGILTPSETYLYYWSNRNPSNIGSLYSIDTAGNNVRLTGDAMIVWGNSFAVVDGWLYFTANDNTNITGDAGGVYRTNGSVAGTALISSTIDASSSSSMYMGAAAGTKYVFAGRQKTTAAGNVELFVSDGTAAGTFLLKEIRAGDAAGFPLNLTSAGGVVYFLATDDGFGHDLLWRTDGTVAGTYQLSGTYGGAFMVSGTRVYFRSHDATHGSEPWVSEGTLATTRVLKDIWPGADGSFGNDVIQRFGSGVVFTANDGTGNALWISDGSEANTVKIATNLGVSTGYLQRTGLPAEVDGKTYFISANALHGNELWVTDGTAAGTHLVKDINPGIFNAPGMVRGVAALPDGRFLFVGNDGASGEEPWVTDGTAAGTMQLLDVNPGAGSSGVGSITVTLGDKLLLPMYEPVNGIELWTTDGTTAGTQLVADINPGSAAPGINGFTRLGDKVYFFATEPEGGRELWASDGTAEGTARVKDIVADGSSLVFGDEPLTTLGSHVLFSAWTSETGSEPWISDGTETGTQMLADLAPGTADSRPASFMVAGTRAFFVARTDGPYHLWVTDGTAAGTAQVGDHVVYPSNLVGVLDGDVVFVDNTNRLYRTDGTAAGTVALSAAGVRVIWPKVAAGRVIFFAEEGDNDIELWASDGVTPDGATQIAEFIAGARSPTWTFPDNVLVLPQGVVFGVKNADAGSGVYFTDGTAAGTVRLAVDESDDYEYLAGAAGENPILITRNQDGGAVWKLIFNLPPAVDAEIPDGNGTQNEAFSYDVSGHFSDAEGDAITYSASGLPPGLAIDATTGVISGTLWNDAAMASPLTVTVTATDAAGGSVSTTFTIVVENVNDAPVVDDDFAVTDEDTTIIIEVLTNDSDPDGDALTVTEIVQDPLVIGSPAMISIVSEGKAIQVTPFLDSTATIEFTYRVSDGELTADANVTVAITPLNDAPRFMNAVVLPIVMDEPFELAVNVYDPESDAITLSAPTLPAWLSFDASSGELTGTPGEEHLGAHEVRLVASDGAAEREWAFTLTVIEPTDAGLSVTLVPLADSAVRGEDIAWTATVTNAGPATANSPVLILRLDHDGLENVAWPAACTADSGGDAAECVLAPLASGESVSLDVKATSKGVEDAFAFAGISSERNDPDANDNTAGATVNVTQTFAAGPARVVGTDKAASVAFGDLDGDGDADLVVGTPAGKATVVYLNDGAGAFTRSGTLGDNALTRGIALVDIDQDGDLDILLANDGANGVYRNQGNAQFQHLASLGTNDSHAVAAADFDADGDIDLVFADDETAGSEVYANNGSDGFTLAVTLATQHARDVVVAEVNGDNDPDVVFATRDDGGRRFTGKSALTFATGTPFGSAGGAALASGLLNGDAKADFVLARVRLGDATPVSGAYSNAFTALAAFGRAESSDVLVLDVDGDGAADVLNVGVNGNHRIHLGDGAGGFAMHEVLIAAAGNAGAAVADVDGDGDIDFAFANADGGVDLYLNGGGGNIGVHRADLAISATLNTTDPREGANITWTLRVVNNGPDGVRGATVEVSGSGLTISSVSGGSCTKDGEAWSCNVPPLANGGELPLTVQAQASAGSRSLNASVSAATTDPVSGNNETTSAVTVRAAEGGSSGGGGGGAWLWLLGVLGLLRLTGVRGTARR